jgi:hypothetical protein
LRLPAARADCRLRMSGDLLTCVYLISPYRCTRLTGTLKYIHSSIVLLIF